MNKLLVVVLVALMVVAELCLAQKPDMAKLKAILDKNPACASALKKIVIN